MKRPRRGGNRPGPGTGGISSPIGAAAAALLHGTGITDPIAEKAILIDSADPGRATPGSSMGTQTGWQPDWGWGELDLNAAYQQRTNFTTDTVPAAGARFYRADAAAAGDRATLVWNRRVSGCLRPGCTGTPLTLTNLHLKQIDPSTGAVIAQSTSDIDNVQQVRSTAAGPVVYAVDAASNIVGASTEPYALAATNQITPLETPQPTTQLSLAATGWVHRAQPVTVTASVANPSHDLSAQDARVTLQLPAGVRLISDAQTQTLGTLQTADSPGATATATWTVDGTADGLEQLTAQTESTTYGEAFTSSAAESFGVDNTPPTVTVDTSSGLPTDPTITVSWSGTDAGSGVRSYDVAVSVDGAPPSPWLSQTMQTAASYTGAAGHSYAFCVRASDQLGNASAYTCAAPVAIAQPGHPPPPPTHNPRAERNPCVRPQDHTRHPPRLHITSPGSSLRMPAAG